MPNGAERVPRCSCVRGLDGTSWTDPPRRGLRRLRNEDMHRRGI